MFCGILLFVHDVNWKNECTLAILGWESRDRVLKEDPVGWLAHHFGGVELELYTVIVREIPDSKPIREGFKLIHSALSPRPLFSFFLIDFIFYSCFRFIALFEQKVQFPHIPPASTHAQVPSYQHPPPVVHWFQAINLQWPTITAPSPYFPFHSWY